MPEERLAKAAAEKPVKLDDSVNKVALSWAKRNGWVDIKDGKLVGTPKWRAEAAKSYAQRVALKAIAEGEIPAKEMLDVLMKRGLVRSITKVGSVTVTITSKGASAEPEKGGIGAITRDVIVSGSWKKEKIRPYDINAPARGVLSGEAAPASRDDKRDKGRLVQDGIHRVGRTDRRVIVLELRRALLAPGPSDEGDAGHLLPLQPQGLGHRGRGAARQGEEECTRRGGEPTSTKSSRARRC